MSQLSATPNPSAKPPLDGREPLIHPGRPIRTFIFTAVTLIAYAFANAFLHYLSSGEWFTGTLDQYAHTLGKPLGDALVTPLSVFSHPWLLLVFGLLWAVVIVVPLLMACLYPVRLCLPFMVLVAVLAQAPILTLFLAGGCVLVAGTVWRSRSPMLAILLGLGPICVYLYFSGSRSSLITQSLERLVLYVPFMVAAAGAAVAGALVIIIARLTRYRPGVVFPVVLVLLVVPVGLFRTQVGDDELAYAKLHAELSASESPFHDELLQKWKRPSETSVTDGDLMDRVQADLASRRLDWVKECDAFYARYSYSPRAIAVLWIRGIALDTHLNLHAMSSGLVRYYDDVPSEDSRDSWQTLLDRFPTDPRAAIACYRLCQLELRAGRIAAGEALLARAQEILSANADQEAQVAPGGDASLQALFARDVSGPSPKYFQHLREQVDALQWLMKENLPPNDGESARAFTAFISLDPLSMSRHDYVDKVLELGEQYKDTPLADNFALAVAESREDPVDRAYALLDLQNIEKSDVSIAANYELSLLAQEGRRNPALGRLLQRPEVYLNRVMAAGENPWRRLAAEQLRTVSTQESPTP